MVGRDCGYAIRNIQSTRYPFKIIQDHLRGIYIFIRSTPDCTLENEVDRTRLLVEPPPSIVAIGVILVDLSSNCRRSLTQLIFGLGVLGFMMRDPCVFGVLTVDRPNADREGWPVLPAREAVANRGDFGAVTTPGVIDALLGILVLLLLYRPTKACKSTLVGLQSGPPRAYIPLILDGSSCNATYSARVPLRS